MGNPLTLENQLAYLAAMIDGEGTVTIERMGGWRKGVERAKGLSPRLYVTNTNPAIIQYVVDIIRKIGVTPHIKTNFSGGRNKRCYWVSVQGLTKVRKVLEAVMPYMVGKLTQAQLILEFITFRGDNPKGQKYCEVEYGILDKIRALNFRGVSTTEDHELGRKFITKDA